MEKGFFKKLFCSHNWEFVKFEDCYENGLRHPISVFKCSHCGKIMKTDEHR